MRKALKSWSTNFYESLTPKLEEGTSVPMVVQNFNKPCLFLQVLRELWELDLKQGEEACIADAIGTYQNEKIDGVVEWINEVKKFKTEIMSQSLNEGNQMNSFWCHTVLLRIRKIRAKRDPNFTTFQQRVSGVGSASLTNMPTVAPLPLHEQLYMAMKVLVNIYYASWKVLKSFSGVYQKIINEMGQFIVKVKLELQQKVHEMNSDWYRNKIAETWALIGKFEPTFFLPSQMAPVSLHVELRCKVRLLRKILCIYIGTVEEVTLNFQKRDIYMVELEQGIKEINKFILEMRPQLQENNSGKNSDWYHKKVQETVMLIAKYYSAFPLPSQDAGSSSVRYTKEQHVPVMKPSLFLQVLRELSELDLKQCEESWIVDVIGSYQNEEFDEVMEWINEVKKFVAETNLQKLNKGNQMNSFWCSTVLLTIRKMRAKRGQNIVKAPLSLREQLYGEIKLLVNIHFAPLTVHYSYNIASHQQVINRVQEFIVMTKQQLQEVNIPETNSHWYDNKISETRAMIDVCEPAFSLQSQELSFHEELRCEVRLLNNTRWIYILTFQVISTGQTLSPQEKYIYMLELEEGIYEIKKFILEMNVQLLENISGKDSDWYSHKIAETRRLIAKCYSAFPQNHHVRSTKELPQIFLSFRGADTRKGFTRYLYEALRNEGFNVFMDDEGLELGDSIFQILADKIEKSKLSIIVFSPNFADSKWCLNEVNKILECKEKNGQLVWPIFYKVEISDVKHQENSYAVAMSKQETEYGKDSEDMKKWRSSLRQVCNLKALEYDEKEYEGDFIKRIVQKAKNNKDLL